MLTAVECQQPSGPRLVAFFGVMYYSGLRPEEAVNLREHNVVLPAARWDAKRQKWVRPESTWSELHIGRATPDAGQQWTDDGADRDRRYLKHRAEGETRRIPCPPELTRLLRVHLERFGSGPDGLLFCGVQGRPLATKTYRRAWDKARRAALAPEQYRSPLARRVYDLRHACLSTWLNAGVPPRQVAEWAGHSVEMLLRIYAKCLEGDDRVGRQRIEHALGGATLHTLLQLARRAGISEEQAKELHVAGKLPPPDSQDAEGAPLWQAATIDAWRGPSG